ncbi:exopolyphosphatase [Serpentinicella alkaliphila]|uniref:exopolyphosphatase n=1 Tax=Serpentinicella alkaliphila TaxID=1734049 RepID=UPI0014047E0A|nr:exopolyphosphatase [Serpentinicella alkaliphila]QUH25388.1 exopolyphosphatase [Serpentinicella alkaliphila]
MVNKVAVIDLGSNTIRMLIMKIYRDRSFKMIDEIKEMVRLSEGMGDKKILQKEPMERTLHVLMLFKAIIEAHEVDEVMAIATAAVRNATNKDEFLKRIKVELDMNFDVIAGEKEAYYGYLGVINTIDIENCVIVDIGGGSTEISLVLDKRFKESISLPYGSIILTEQFLGKEQVTQEKIQTLENFMIKVLSGIKWLKSAVGLPIIGLGGTIRTLAKVNKNKVAFPLNSLHNYQLDHKEVSRVYKEITSKDLDGRIKLPGVNKERADIIIGGLVPIKVIMEYLNSNNLVISGNGVREGIFYEYYLKQIKCNNMRLDDVLEHSVTNILKNYNLNLQHCYHVRKLALEIFDQTQSIHKFDEGYRKLLSTSSLLHDIGNYIDYYNHHQHGFYLTLNSKINGMDNKEKLLCAYLVGFHRDADFKEDWKKYNMLIKKEDYDNIKKLSIFLKIAEKLDRSEYASVKNIECDITKKVVIIKVITDNNPILEIEAALKYKKDFLKAFKKDLIILK